MKHNIHNITVFEMLFVAEILKSGNGADAVRRASVIVGSADGYNGDYPSDEAYRLMKRPAVRAELERCQAEIRAQNDLTAQTVIDDIQAVLTGDPRDLIQYVTGACRHCHGANHEYHYTAGELAKARRVHESEPANVGVPFYAEGGAGFNAYRDPHPDCPECGGRGVQRAQIKDTRSLTPREAAMYAGIKVTRHGVELLVRDKDKARADAARILGMNKEKVEHSGSVGLDVSKMTNEQLAALIEQERGK